MPRPKKSQAIRDAEAAAAKAKAGRTSAINTWVATDKQKVVDRDGKIFICYFDRIFKQPKLSIYDKFYIKKGSYENQLDIIVRYINFFINHYDPDNELVTAYLKIKFAVDDNHLYTADNMDSYINFVYEILFTDTMIDKINRLVEDNYLDDIEQETDEKRRKYKNNERKHLESLEFTNQHIKILLRISFGMKIMAPVMLHYHAVNTMKIEKDSDNIFRFFKPLFKIFGRVPASTNTAYISQESNAFFVFNNATKYYDMYEDDDAHNMVHCNLTEAQVIEKSTNPETGEIVIEPRNYTAEYNMYNKLFVYVKAKVNESYANNSTMYAQREIFGIDIFSVIQSFVHRVLISENMVKYKFNEHWDAAQKKYKENIIGFNKTIIKFQLMYFLKEQYSKNLTEVTNTKNSDGLSGGDKMAMNLTKIDEGITILAEINVPITIQYIEDWFKIDISDEEIDYYIEHHRPDKIQIELVHSYFAKYFGSIRNLALLTRRQYITLMLILKKKLMRDLGYPDDNMIVESTEPNESDDENESETKERDIRPAALPYILSGNLEDHINTRVIRNLKFTQKIEDAYTYRELQSGAHWYLNFIRPGYDMQLVSSLINTRFTYVEYTHPELLGKEIIYSDDKVADEILFFLKSI